MSKISQIRDQHRFLIVTLSELSLFGYWWSSRWIFQLLLVAAISFSVFVKVSLATKVAVFTFVILIFFLPFIWQYTSLKKEIRSIEDELEELESAED